MAPLTVPYASVQMSRGMKHIDRKELYTNLEARIEYLHSFLDFSSADIEALNSGAKYLKALIPAVVNIVYKKLLQYDITARAFTERSTSYEGPVDAAVHENSPLIQHRKKFLRGYLAKLCSDPSKMEFWEYLDKVGMMHVGLGRQHPLHIEYIHISACLGFIQDILLEAILSHPRLHLTRKIAIVKALSKILWIQNDLFAKWYVTDGAEYKDEQPEIVIEEEGYLHGKKVLQDLYGESYVEGLSRGSSDDDEAKEAKEKNGAVKPVNVSGGCPFSRVAAAKQQAAQTEAEVLAAAEGKEKATVKEPGKSTKDAVKGTESQSQKPQEIKETVKKPDLAQKV